jgi:hypothetical protein
MPRIRTCKHCARPATKGNLCDLHQVGESVPTRTDNLAWRSSKGQRVRKQYLADHPYCFDCMNVYGRPVPAAEVHHIAEQMDRPDLVFDSDNLLALCHDCHNARHGKGIGGKKS